MEYNTKYPSKAKKKINKQGLRATSFKQTICQTGFWHFCFATLLFFKYYVCILQNSLGIKEICKPRRVTYLTYFFRIIGIVCDS